MKAIAKRTSKNTFAIIDTRNGKVLKRNVEAKKAQATAIYYDQEIKKAEAFWA